jgi:hypothetical protein
MTTNGTIQIVTPGTATRDQSGDYSQPTANVGNAIPCLIYDIRNRNRGIHEGDKYTTSSFEILIEGDKLKLENTQQIKITDTKGNQLGTFTVQSFVLLSNTYRTKITV